MARGVCVLKWLCPKGKRGTDYMYSGDKRPSATLLCSVVFPSRMLLPAKLKAKRAAEITVATSANPIPHTRPKKPRKAVDLYVLDAFKAISEEEPLDLGQVQSAWHPHTKPARADGCFASPIAVSPSAASHLAPRLCLRCLPPTDHRRAAAQGMLTGR